MSTNTPEYTVSELAQSLKRTVEETFGHVRVKGELGRVTIAKSGHCYLDVKDDKAVINSIIWKGVMGRLSMRPEEGMEVICEGRLSTYPGRSNYQLIIEKMELAGAGALMALYEKRKKMLEAEGLFSPERKVELPFLPRTIGVVTSPTGSVIRDILHRITDRFPSHVLVWPVLVQGDKAAEQIAEAITGFNQAEGFPRPDVLIVARGGGSMEDLWCFNEEIVARAAANSDIPLISAVGHETDWTLIDYVADYRAPTPTGAAEVAVPVREDWLATVEDYGARALQGLRRLYGDRQTAMRAARLPRLSAVIAPAQQRLDLALSSLPSAERLFEPQRNLLARQRMRSPEGLIREKRATLAGQRLPSLDRLIAGQKERLDNRASRLGAALRLVQTRESAKLAAQQDQLAQQQQRAQTALQRGLDSRAQRLDRAGKLLDAYSYQGVLDRGYALVQDKAGMVVRSAAKTKPGQPVALVFADGSVDAVVAGKSPVKKAKRKPASGDEKTQTELF